MGDANRTKQGNPKLSAPNRLRRVKVTGLFGIHTVDIEVEGSADPASPRLRIIFDDNGAGKTTVLKAIHHLLSWRDGEFQWSVHGEGSVEGGGALVVEAAAALVVDDVGGVLGLGGGDRGEVGAAGEPPAPLPVEVLDLAALPR